MSIRLTPIIFAFTTEVNYHRPVCMVYSYLEVRNMPRRTTRATSSACESMFTGVPWKPRKGPGVRKPAVSSKNARAIDRAVNRSLGQPVKNRFKVPAKQWNRWSNHARSVFNKLYWAMRPSCQSLFAAHPKALPMPREQWDTLRWNTAWRAADIAEGGKNGE